MPSDEIKDRPAAERGLNCRFFQIQPEGRLCSSRRRDLGLDGSRHTFSEEESDAS